MPPISHPSPKPTQVAVVPHTHWDREWYLPFQAFRMALVEMLDDFLPRLDSDGGYDHFLLDGQMAVVDDYLDLRPQAEPRLRRLVESGKLTVGPWYILMDEFLVSGETIVRDLQLGLRRAAQLGGGMEIGYLPDMFGHIAQMPQLLRLAGFAHAVVWRGVPQALDRTAFWWRAPDGSTVRAEYLLGGYGNGASVPDDADALIRRTADFVAERTPFALEPAAPLLWMNGTDHQAPQPWLGQVLAAANTSQDTVHFELTSLPAYLAAAPTEGLGSWTGELRSGARANLLMGVASNRADVKVAAARAERALERQAEPLCALWLAPHRWPGAELDLAWRQMIRNSAHDSICACSHDRVATAVLQRYDDVFTIVDALRARALAHAATVLPAGGPMILNPSARTRSGLVEVEVDGDDPIPGTQLVAQTAAATHQLQGHAADFDHLLSLMEDAGFQLDPAGSPAIDEHDGTLCLTYTTTGTRHPDPAGEALIAEASARALAHPARPLRIIAHRSRHRRVVARIEDVPGFGWKRLNLGKGAGQPEPAAAPAPEVAVSVHPGGATLVNDKIDVAVDGDTGEWSLTDRSSGRRLCGLGKLVDGGDAGDTYNYSPPENDRVVDQPESVTLHVLENGPLRGVLRVVRRYWWPRRLEAMTALRVDKLMCTQQLVDPYAPGREGERAIDVTFDLELRADEDLLRVTLSFDNRCRDHRVRALFPLDQPVERSQAECAYAVVERGLMAEGGPHEYGLPTFPSRRFVRAGTLIVLHEGLLEYELVNGGQVLALTVLRATGLLSRPVLSYRDNAAGPTLALEGPQMQGPVQVRFALHAGSGDPYELSDQAWVPFEVITPRPTARLGMRHADEPPPTAVPDIGTTGESGSLLAVAGAEVAALQRVDGDLELRVFNPCAEETTVRLPGRRGQLVDLRGRPVEDFEESLALRPWGIATLRLRS